MDKQLNQAPAVPEDFFQEENRKQAKKHRWFRKFVLFPLTAVLAVLGVFMFLINVSPRIAYAFEKVPVLDQLTGFLRFSHERPSTPDIGYIQELNLTQSLDDVTVCVDFLVVGDHRVTVFYRLDMKQKDAIFANVKLLSPDGSVSPGMDFSSFLDHTEGPLDGLKSFTVQFSEDIPSSFLLHFDLYYRELPHSEQTPRTAFFLLEFDPANTAPRKHFDLDRTLVLLTEDGYEEKLRLTGLDTYADHVNFTLEGLRENHSWYQMLRGYVETPDGTRYDLSDGTARIYDWSFDHPRFFFTEDRDVEQIILQADGILLSNASALTLGLLETEYELKDQRPAAHVDLVNGTAENLPEGTELVRTAHTENGWELTLLSDGPAYLFEGYDAQGRPWTRLDWYYASDRQDPVTGTLPDVGQSYMITILKDYPYDEIWLGEGMGVGVYFDRPVCETVRLTDN